MTETINETRRDEVVVTSGVSQFGKLEVEKATINVKLGGVVKAVQVERYSPGHCWNIVSHRVVVRFKTGNKEHVVPASLVRKGDVYGVSVQGFRNANTCQVVRWATDEDNGSGWTKK